MSAAAVLQKAYDWRFAAIAEARHRRGVHASNYGDLPLWENAVLERYASPTFARLGLVRRERMAEVTTPTLARPR